MTLNHIYIGHVLDVLKDFPDKKIQSCITSPPYWSLRSYKSPLVIWDAEEGCEHKWIDATYIRNNDMTAGEIQRTNVGSVSRDEPVNNAFCLHCSAWRGELGLEPHPQLYLQHLWQIFEEVMRVLKDDGCLFVVINDTYCGGKSGNTSDPHKTGVHRPNECKFKKPALNDKHWLQPKQRLMIPERFAIGMQERGYILRNNIIWWKRNHMPSSAQDRFTNSYEHVYFFTKKRKYYFDLDAVREPILESSINRINFSLKKNETYGINTNIKYEAVNFSPQATFMRNGRKAIHTTVDINNGKNPGDLWDITTVSYPGAHYATFPPKLPERCILCSTKEGDIVLDPFAGSGTTCMVAYNLQRKYIGIDIQEEYIKQQYKRLGQLNVLSEV